MQNPTSSSEVNAQLRNARQSAFSRARSIVGSLRIHHPMKIPCLVVRDNNATKLYYNTQQVLAQQ